MVSIETVTFYEVKQLRKRERYYQDLLRPKFGIRACLSKKEATEEAYKRHREKRVDKTREIKGYRKVGDKYHSSITLKGKSYHLGVYDTAKEVR